MAELPGKLPFIAGCLVSAGKASINKYLSNKDRPWKYQDLADAMKEIIREDACNDTYKSDDLLKRDVHSDVPLKKCITDITEI